jgi:acetyl-CoA/propionyl-CoA carboxylase, biotin carboxylase, biotin carboxyl carrier protein
MVTGVDIVREQVLIAAGEELSLDQDALELRGHAIECRINAEAAHKSFAPAPGRIDHYVEPGGPGVRVDSGLRAGSEVTPLYDPMVAKLIVWDRDRERATARMLRALGEYEISPLQTLIPFHQAILVTEQWARGETCRDLTEDRKWLRALAPPAGEPAAAGEVEKVESSYAVEVDGRLHRVKVIGADSGNPAPAAARRPPRRKRSEGSAGGASGPALPSPLQGTILKVAVDEGAEVEEGALVCVIEAMKMENEITAHRSGKVGGLAVREGAAVNAGDQICTIE